MSRIVRFGTFAVAAFVLAACSDSPSTPRAAAPQGPASFSAAQAAEQVMSGEVIVKLRGGADVDAVAKAHGLSVGYAGYKNSFHVLRGNAGNEHSNAAALRGDDRVEYAEPNYLRQPTTINPNLWAFYNPGGLNMKYSSGQNKGKPLPASYASTLDADEDNVEGYAAGGSDIP